MLDRTKLCLTGLAKSSNTGVSLTFLVGGQLVFTGGGIVFN